MFDLDRYILYHLTALEVNGVTCIGAASDTVERLRKIVEQESNGYRSVRMCKDNPCFCECYIVK